MRAGSLIVGAVMAAVLVSAAGGALAQPTAAAGQAPDSRALVTELRRQIAEHYVVPSTRPAIEALLAKGLTEGRYDVNDASLLAERINEDLSAASNDKHLGIHYDPRMAAMIGERRRDDDVGGPAWERMAQVGNHGIREMRLLDGNVRYLALDGFVWAGPKSAEAYDVAMRFLKEGDAAVIDLRRNGGGSPEAVQYVISHFMEPDRPLVAFHMGAAGKVDRLSTLASLPAGRMVGKPLYVLISGHSASAAEEFVGHVSGFKLGELVGATTAGAAYRNDHFALGNGWIASISVGRPELAATGGDWEARGFAPNIAADPGKALEVAHLHALKRLAATAPPDEKPMLEARRAILDAQLNPVDPQLPLSAYAGMFGERTLTVEGGRLFFQRSGGPKSALVPAGGNSFLLEGSPGSRIEFKSKDGSVSGFELIRSDGSRTPVARSS